MAIFKFATKMEWLYTVFRIIIGAIFGLHGLQKLGAFGQGMTGLSFFIGICELLIGLGILLGFLTRLAALGGVIIMIGALIKAHWPKGFMPLGNGEPAWLFLAAFLVIFAWGARKWSLDKLFFKKEVF
jgi:putative oxidoreductase